MERPEFTFVLPAYNEAENLRPLAARLRVSGAAIGDSYEIIWVDDGSTDETARVLAELAAEDSRIRPLYLARNFGHMAALTAGIEAAQARGAVVCLDSDGQHPPELIPDLVRRWRDGADIVQTVRVESADAGPVKRTGSRLFYTLLNRLAKMDLPQGAADFRLLDRQVVDVLNGLPERVRFMRALVFWVGFRRDLAPFEAAPRMAGKTKYSFWKMLQFALSGITSFSTRPLRIAFVLGVLVTLGAMSYGAYILWCFACGIPLVPGWTSLLLAVLGLSGMQLITLGIASEYLARLYAEQKHRPVYVLRKPRAHDPTERKS